MFIPTLTPLLFPAALFVAYFDCADREDDCDYEEEDSPDEASRHSLPLGVLRNVVLVLLTAKNTQQWLHNAHWLAQVSTLDLMGIKKYTLESFQTHYPEQ